MSLKRFYFDKNIRICRTCMFIDEYTLNVNDNGKIPCKKYKRCTERQADYLDIFDEETKTIVTNPNLINNDDEKR